MHKHTIDSLAEALYEGHPSLINLAEEMARQYGKASALSFYDMMGKDVQYFWKDIARQIIEHSKEWQKNNGSCCVLSDTERKRLKELRLFGEISKQITLLNCPDCGVKPGYQHKNGCNVERCSVCGRQNLMCKCAGNDKEFSKWKGIWPGLAEATLLGIGLNEFYKLGYHRVFFVKNNTPE